MARMKEKYLALKPQLKAQLEIENEMQIPKVEKIMISVGAGFAMKDNKLIQNIQDTISVIAGQRACVVEARKSVAGFKVREGMPVGVITSYSIHYTKLYEVEQPCFAAEHVHDGITAKLQKIVITSYSIHYTKLYEGMRFFRHCRIWSVKIFGKMTVSTVSGARSSPSFLYGRISKGSSNFLNVSLKRWQRTISGMISGFTSVPESPRRVPVKTAMRSIAVPMRRSMRPKRAGVPVLW